MTTKYFDGIYRKTISVVTKTWKNSKWRKPVLITTAILSLTGSIMGILDFPEQASALVQPNGRLYYGDQTNTALRFQTNTYDFTFNGEASFTHGGSASLIAHTVTKPAPTRDEVMVGALTVDGQLKVIKGINGYDVNTDYALAWTNSGTTGAQTCNSATEVDCTRAFDIAYERLSGRAMVVYADTTNQKLYYCYWDGSAWGPQSACTPTNGTNDISLSSNGRPDFVSLKAKGGSNELMMGVSIDVGGVHEVEVYRWDGDSWEDQLVATDTTNASVNTLEAGQVFDVEWESNSGDALVVWGTTSAGSTLYRRKPSGSAWGSDTTGPALVGGNGVVNTMNLDADPVSNRIAFASTDSTNDGNLSIWKADGSTTGWTMGNEDATLETDNPGSQYADVIWQKSGSVAVWVAHTGTTAFDWEYQTATCNGSGCTFSSIDASIALPSGTIDDGTYVRLFASPNSNDIMMLAGDIDQNLLVNHWDGSAWEGTPGAALEASASPGTADGVAQGMAGAFTYVPYQSWQRNWRFFDDETANDPSTGLNSAAENATPTGVDPEEFIRLRMNINDPQPQAQTDARKKLQYTSGCDPNASETACTWNDVGDTSETSAVWRYASRTADGAAVCADGSHCDDNQTFSTNRLTGSTQTGWYTTDKDAAGGSNMDHNASAILELDFPLKAENVANSTTYYFRTYDIDQDRPVRREQDNDGSNDCASATCTYPSLTTAAPVYTISGTVYMADETTAATTGNGGPCDSSTAVISIRAGGGTADTVSCSSTNGTFDKTLSNVTLSAGAEISIYLTSSMKANTIYLSDGSSDSGINLYENRVTVRHENAGPMTIVAMDSYDSDQNDTDMLFDAEDSAPDTLIVESGNELHVESSKSFFPAGNVTTPKMHVKGTVSGSGNEYVFNGTGTGTSRPLYVDGGTFTAGATSSVTFSGAGAVDVHSTTYHDLKLQPTTGTETYTLMSGTFDINGNLTVNNGATLTVDVNTNDPVINLVGNLTLNTSTTWTASTTAAFTFKPSGTVTWTDSVATKQDLGLVTIGSGTSTPVVNLGSSVKATKITLESSHGLSANGSNKITLIGTSGTLFTNSGTFTQSTGEVEVTSASGTPTFLSGATTFHKLTINSAATVVNAGSAITINNAAGADLTITNGVFNVDAGTLTGPGSGNGTFTIASGATLCMGGTTNATNSTCNSGVTQLNSKTMPTFQTYAFDSASTVKYLSQSQTISATPAYGNLTINPKLMGSTSHTLNGAMTVNGNLEINPTNSGNSWLQIGNGFSSTTSGVPALAGLSSTTVAFARSTGVSTLLGTYSFDGTNWALTGNNLSISGMSGPALAPLSSTSVAYIDAGNDSLRTYSFDGTDWSQTGNSLSVTGISTTPALAALNSTTVAFVDDGNDALRTYSFDGTNWSQVGNSFSISGLTTSPALAPLSSSTVAYIDGNNDALRKYSFDGTDWSQTGNSLSISGVGSVPALAGFSSSLVAFIDSTNDTLSTYSFSGSDWTVDSLFAINNVSFPALATLSSTNIAFIDETNDSLRNYNYSNNTNLLTVNAGGHITVSSSKTTTITGSDGKTSKLDLRPISTNYNLTTGGLTIGSGGTLDVAGSTSTINVSGNYANSGTFTAGSSTVTLDGTSTQSLSGAMTSGSAFYNLTITNSSGTSASTCERDSFVASVDFAADVTATNDYTITTANVRVEYDDGNTYTFNNISWNGQATGTRIYFRSSAASGTWLLNVSGTQAVSYVNVSRSDATTGNVIDASNGTSFDCGNNTDWDFGLITISGTCDQFDQTTDCTEDGGGIGEVAVAINGSLQAQVDLDIDGAWQINDVPAPDTGDIVTVFINNPDESSGSAVAVTKYDGSSNITSVILYERHLTLGSADNQTLSNADIDAYDNSVSGDADVFFEVNAGNDLTVDTGGLFSDERLFIVTGNTYRPDSGNSGNVATVNLEIDGTFVTDGNAITINGSWRNDGTFTAATGNTVTFNSTATGRTLAGSLTGSNNFFNVTFNGSGGEWILQAALEVENELILSNGTLDSNTSSNFAVTTYIIGTTGTGWTLKMRDSIWTVTGVWDTSSSATDYTNIEESTSELVLDGSGVVIVLGATNAFTPRFYDVSVAPSASDDVTLSSNLAFSNIFSLGAGTFELNSLDLYVSSTNANPLSINASGTFGTGTGRIITSGSTNFTFPAHDYNTLLFETHNTGFKTTLSGATTFDDINIGCCSRASELDTNGHTLTVEGDIFWASSIAILTAGSSTINVGGNWLNTSSGVFNEGTSHVIMTSSSATNLYSGSQDFHNLTHSGSGQLTFNTNAITVLNDLNNSGGTLTGSVNVTVNGSVSGVGAITMTGSSTFEQRVAAAETFGTSSGSNNWTFINLIFSNSAGSDSTITPNAGTGWIIVSTLYQVGRGTDTHKTVIDNNTSNDRVLDINGSVSITAKGTLQASNSASFTVADDWTLTSEGTFTHNNGTVIFDTTATARFTGPTTFYNFSSTTAAKTLEFTSGETFTIASGGLFTITGGANPNEIHIHSSDGTTQWFINHQGTESVTNAHISDSGCDGSSTDISTSNSVDDGNNGSCWQFGSTFDQSAYRFANNEDGTTVNYTGSPAQDSALTVASTGQAFRLRMLIHVGGSNLAQNGETFKLQYGEKTAANCTTGVSWGDVATGSGVIRYKGNAPADGDNLTGNAGDPTHEEDSIINQDYEEANNFTNSVAAINSGQDGLWDFSLENNSSVGGKRYCFKAVKSAGDDLDTYSAYPEVLIDEELVFSLDTSSINFGIIQPGANPVDDDNTLTVNTNASGGFVIYGWTTQPMTKGAHTLPDWTGSNATPTTFGNGSFGFGYTTDDDDLTGGDPTRFDSGTLFAGFTHSGPGDPVVDTTSGPVSTSNKITYRIAGSTGQQAGTYTTVVVYVVVPTF